MVNVHNVVGTLVLVSFLALAVSYALGIGGRPVTWTRPLSFAAATLLLIQYLLGFSLLGAGNRNATSHYVFALLALAIVGFEHGVARTRDTARERGLYGALAAGLTFVLVVVAYLIGTSDA